ncbi:hypothetical protein [Gemmobacter sp.]|uniref:hypothetical protein n=1 Tax=Gemmobacter sp. TaxID=1898957 RepID=UPI0025BB9D97|nr:hypothetical protein [Gemmobacter sp.]
MVGLVLISTVFSILNPVFLAPNNLVLFDCAMIGVFWVNGACRCRWPSWQRWRPGP